MRPLELRLKGFQSYAEEHVFDFRDRNLLGIVGPIGSGKSSLLDGIAFALYGRTPRAGKSTRDLIHQRSAAAQVELWFEVEGECWRAVRALRRKGQSAHNLYRHAEDDPGSDVIEHLEQERQVTARVEELLGLPFEGFNRSVFLAQNRFAEFLHATESQRDAVLKGVFGLDRLDRMAEVAKNRRDGLRAELGDLERLRLEVATDEEALAAARPELAEAATRLQALESVRDRWEQLTAVGAAALRDAEDAGRRLAGLNDLAAQLPAKGESGRLLGRAVEASERLEAAQSGLAGASAALEVARRHQHELFSKIGDAAALERASGLVAHVDSLAKQVEAARMAVEVADESARAATEEELASTAAIEETAAGKARAAEAEAAAAGKAAQAEHVLHDARHAAMALSLRGELVVGGTCPVCEQAVASLPPARKAEAVAAAETALESARAALMAARAESTKAAAAAAAAQARREAAGRASQVAAQSASDAAANLGRLSEEHAAEVLGLQELLGSEDPAASLEQRRRQVAEAVALVERDAKAETSARAVLDEVRSDQRKLDGELVQLATTVATLAGQLGGEIQPAADVAELTYGLDQLRKLWEERAAEVKMDEERALARRSTAETQATELIEGLGLPAGESLKTAHQRAVEDQAQLGERVRSLEKRIARFDQLEAESAETTRRLDTYTVLADDLLPSRFLKFILDEERRALGRLGSEHFERMSRGRYRFTDDGSFNIVDLTAAEVQRKSDTLSGGETFLASLSLALALAEMVARSGGRLDAFFLDEGFGSLDPEHLDLAMEGIEALVGGNRLVAVVSHVPELRERVEDLIQLDRDAVTGATVVVRS